jgi:hypothetical protein
MNKKTKVIGFEGKHPLELKKNVHIRQADHLNHLGCIISNFENKAFRFNYTCGMIWRVMKKDKERNTLHLIKLWPRNEAEEKMEVAEMKSLGTWRNTHDRIKSETK